MSVPQNTVTDLNDVMFTNATRAESCCVKPTRRGLENMENEPNNTHIHTFPFRASNQEKEPGIRPAYLTVYMFLTEQSTNLSETHTHTFVNGEGKGN